MKDNLEEQIAEWIIGLPNKYFYSQQTKSPSDESKYMKSLNSGLRKVENKTADTPKEILEELDLYLNWVGSLR